MINTIKVLLLKLLVILIMMQGCSRLDDLNANEQESIYKIIRYNKDGYLEEWNSKTKVYIKFEDNFIEVLGDYTIQKINDKKNRNVHFRGLY